MFVVDCARIAFAEYCDSVQNTHRVLVVIMLRSSLRSFISRRKRPVSTNTPLEPEVSSEAGFVSDIQPTLLIKTSWTILKNVLETIRDGSDPFFPLKTALVGVVKVMDIVDVSSAPPNLYNVRT